jgi:hypothetical protein
MSQPSLPVVTKLLIESVLNDFPEVAWDRFTFRHGQITVFGWIDREDSYKDFMLVRFVDDSVWFVTSSAKYSAEFSARSGGSTHTQCQRVEGVLNVRTTGLGHEVSRIKHPRNV